MGEDITDKTKGSLFAALTTIPFLVGGIYWLTTIYEQGAEAARTNVRQDQDLARQANSLELIKDMVVEIRERTIRIEDKLNR